ncbi:MAG: hypothetical protein ACP6IP_08915 [Candidatus Njordarchaeia archaeon]
MLSDVIVLDERGDVIFFKTFTSDAEERRLQKVLKIVMLSETVKKLSSEIFKGETRDIKLEKLNLKIFSFGNLTYIFVSQKPIQYDIEKLVKSIHPIITKIKKPFKNLSRMEKYEIWTKINDIVMENFLKITYLKKYIDSLDLPIKGLMDDLINGNRDEQAIYNGLSIEELPYIEEGGLEEALRAAIAEDFTKAALITKKFLGYKNNDIAKAIFINSLLNILEYEEAPFRVRLIDLFKLASTIKDFYLRRYIERKISTYFTFSEETASIYIDGSTRGKMYERFKSENLLGEIFLALQFPIDEEMEDEIYKTLKFKENYETKYRIHAIEREFAFSKNVGLDSFIDAYSKIYFILERSLINGDAMNVIRAAITLFELLIITVGLENIDEGALEEIFSHIILDFTENYLDEILDIKKVPLSKKYEMIARYLSAVSLYTMKFGTLEILEDIYTEGKSILEKYLRLSKKSLQPFKKMFDNALEMLSALTVMRTRLPKYENEKLIGIKGISKIFNALTSVATTFSYDILELMKTYILIVPILLIECEQKERKKEILDMINILIEMIDERNIVKQVASSVVKLFEKSSGVS